MPWAIAIAAIVSSFVCGRHPGRQEERPDTSRDVEPAAPYQAEVEEGLGAAVAILIDTSGSMRDT